MSAIQTAMDRALAPDNVTLGDRAGSGLWRGLVVGGLAFIAIAVIGGLAGDGEMKKTALHALHTGFLSAIAFPLAAMAFVMMLHQTAAGWSATIRRPFEHMMSLLWLAAPLFFGVLLLQALFTASHSGEGTAPFVWNWMDASYTAGDPLYESKKAYLNTPFFLIRALVYLAVWIVLSMSLYGLSTRQDVDGDRWHTRTMRKISAVGLVLFAFTVAFAGFDWVMTLDFHWFSTMLGVHFFARSMVSAIALGTVTLIVLRSLGRLHVCFTEEHLHDLSKLVFAFLVFWAYISFSQYFLIWYANIPEETAYFVIRKEGGWAALSWILPVAHFLVPFIVLLPRPWRRSRGLIGLMCVYLIVMQLLDGYWYIRPEVKGVGPWQWVDLVGVLGPVLVFLGLYVRKLASGPLIPLKDPRLSEALHHRYAV